MKRSSALLGIALSMLITCPALAFEVQPFKGDVHAYGPIQDWTGHDVWIKAPLGREHDVKSYGPLQDWTGQNVWVKAEIGVRGQTDSYGPVKDWTGQEVWIK